MILFPSGRAAQEAIVGGAVAWGTVAETPVMFAAMNNLPVRIIGSMAVYEIFNIAARKEIKSAADLKGKRVGFAQGTNAQVYLARALGKAGLSRTDITPINLSPPDMVTSLVNGQIDACVWTEPHLAQALTLGKDRFHMIEIPGLYSTYSSIVATQKTVADRPDVLVNSLRAMKDAVRYMKENREAAITFVAEKIKMDRAIAEREWDRIPFEITMDKQGIVKEMRAQAEWAIENNLVPPGSKVPDFEQFVVTTIHERAQAAK